MASVINQTFDKYMVQAVPRNLSDCLRTLLFSGSKESKYLQEEIRNFQTNGNLKKKTASLICLGFLRSKNCI